MDLSSPPKTAPIQSSPCISSYQSSRIPLPGQGFVSRQRDKSPVERSKQVKRRGNSFGFSATPLIYSSGFNLTNLSSSFSCKAF